MQRQSAATGDMNTLGERGDGDLSASAAENVDWGDGLNFFEAFGEDHECGRHEGADALF